MPWQSKKYAFLILLQVRDIVDLGTVMTFGKVKRSLEFDFSEIPSNEAEFELEVTQDEAPENCRGKLKFFKEFESQVPAETDLS